MANTTNTKTQNSTKSTGATTKSSSNKATSSTSTKSAYGKATSSQERPIDKANKKMAQKDSASNKTSSTTKNCGR